MKSRILLSVLVAAVMSISLLSLAGPAQAAFPGENGKIAFTSSRDGNYEIYAMNADGSEQTRLTDNAASDYAPDWSPDGEKIAFTSYRDGEVDEYGQAVSEVYVMNADGSEQTRLTDNAADDYSPAWSPDGNEIVFHSFRDSSPDVYTSDIYTMNADGSDQTRLTSSPFRDVDPDWSPDGSKVVFVRYDNHGTDTNGYGTNGIHVISADGTVTRLTSNESGPSGRNPQDPDWSPDGEKILFSSSRYGGSGTTRSSTFVMNADGSEETELAGGYSESRPAWSPDGRKFVFSYSFSTPGQDPKTVVRGEIYSANADGTSRTNLTNNEPSLDFGPDWGVAPGSAPTTPPTPRFKSEALPTLSIDQVRVTESNSRTSAAAFTVTLSKARGKAITVDYATEDGSAKTPADYASTSGTLTFAPGETEKTIKVPIKGDKREERNETFKVVLSKPTNATIEERRGTGMIVDNDKKQKKGR